jgi:hypothetical protein
MLFSFLLLVFYAFFVASRVSFEDVFPATALGRAIAFDFSSLLRLAPEQVVY